MIGTTAHLSSDDSQEIKEVSDSPAPWPLPFKALLTGFWSRFQTKHSFHTKPAGSEALFKKKKIIFWFWFYKYCFFCQRPFQGSNPKHLALPQREKSCVFCTESVRDVGGHADDQHSLCTVEDLPWTTLVEVRCRGLIISLSICMQKHSWASRIPACLGSHLPGQNQLILHVVRNNSRTAWHLA